MPLVARGSITPAQNQGFDCGVPPFHAPPSNARVSPMKLLVIEPESSNVTMMFGSTEAERSGGVAPRSGGSFGATNAPAEPIRPRLNASAAGSRRRNEKR